MQMYELDQDVALMAVEDEHVVELSVMNDRLMSNSSRSLMISCSPAQSTDRCGLV